MPARGGWLAAGGLEERRARQTRCPLAAPSAFPRTHPLLYPMFMEGSTGARPCPVPELRGSVWGARCPLRRQDTEHRQTGRGFWAKHPPRGPWEEGNQRPLVAELWGGRRCSSSHLLTCPWTQNVPPFQRTFPPLLICNTSINFLIFF